MSPRKPEFNQNDFERDLENNSVSPFFSSQSVCGKTMKDLRNSLFEFGINVYRTRSLKVTGNISQLVSQSGIFASTRWLVFFVFGTDYVNSATIPQLLDSSPLSSPSFPSLSETSWYCCLQSPSFATQIRNHDCCSSLRDAGSGIAEVRDVRSPCPPP